ncbi:MAG: HDOD domain-containing protein [Candidatus Cloacimonetes bacterium]|nr:HDOD domain-containing protein [Candidatus Cloacimonadota bacterium]
MQHTHNGADTGQKMSLQDLIEQVNKSDIGSLRQNVVRILSLVHNPATSAHELSDLIQTDPPLCSRILRVANSAFYGSQRHVGAIRQAIIWLGFNTVKELALSQKVFELFQNGNGLADFSLKNLWNHSMLVAVGSKLVYRREFVLSGEEAFTAGLLHELGLIIEAQFCKEVFAYDLIHQHKGNMRQLEDAILGYNHCDIGGALAKAWEFPDFISSSIKYHHTPELSPERGRRLVQTVFIADTLATRIYKEFNDEPAENKATFDACMRDLSIESEALDLLAKELEKERQILVEKGLML